jgi:predicted Zn-dependent peptidase
VSHALTTLPSGVRVATERMASVRSVALGFWVDVGSRVETHDEAGLSHLIEHLLFKGSERYGSLEIDQLFDAMGAEVNAGTGKESTSVYTRVLDRHLPRAFEVMADMVWRPAFEDVDNERQVVLEEIAMYEDDPQDKVFDVFGQAVFGDDPLGRAIIGRAEVIRDTPVDQIAAFHAARYRPDRVVIAAAGSVEHDELVAWASAAVGDWPAAGGAAVAGAPVAAPRVRFERKDTEQFHLCLGGAGIARDDDRRFALRVLDAISGGSTSSRLFQEVREKRGLAYAVYTFQSQYAGAGQNGVYVGTRGDRLSEAVEVIAQELARLREEPVAEDELRRAKENVKGRLVLSLESTVARMNRLGSSLLYGLPLLEVDELLERIEAVTLEDVAELAGELWAPEGLSVAGIGPDPERFRAVLEPLGPVAAAA